MNDKNFPPINKEKFQFVHDAKEFSKIKDEKIKTKSTTYVKDAFKRFCKNKSSVVAAIIIGILMLGSVFVPVFSPYNTTETQVLEASLLPPKLFDGGFGFWDGCEEQTGVLKYDEEINDYVVTATDFNRPNAIKSELKAHDVVYYDYAGPNFTGGIIRISARDLLDKEKPIYYQPYNFVKMTSTDNFKVSITMDDTDNIKDGYKLAPYRILLGIYKTKSDKNPTYLTLKDWNTDYPEEDNTLDINLSQALEDAGKTSESLCKLRFEIQKSESNLCYAWFKKVEFSCDNEELDEQIHMISIIDPNGTSLLTTDDQGLWVSNGATDVHHAEYAKVTYRYDLYEHYFGLTTKVIGKSTFDTKYSDWCYFDWSYIDSHPNEKNNIEEINKHFTVYNEKLCPLTKNSDGYYINSFNTYTLNGTKLYELNCNIQYYKYLGWSSIPRYLFGTDDSGRDVFTHSFRCLKNSLGLSLICCSVCFVVGLIWGSISGYYGGTVDLVMERITDILAGIPSTVVLTLMMLLLGRTTATFALAVCLTGWIGTSSLARTQFYRFKNRESVLAARTLGARDSRLIFKHILPNSLGTIVTSSVLSIPGFVFTEASLSFLHLGLDSGDSFGVILSENQAFLSTRPALIYFPTIILCLLMISFNLFGNGLRDALNPTLKGGE